MITYGPRRDKNGTGCMRTTKARTSLCPGVGLWYMYDEIVDIFGGLGSSQGWTIFYYYFYYLFSYLFSFYLLYFFLFIYHLIYLFIYSFFFCGGGGGGVISIHCRAFS